MSNFIETYRSEDGSVVICDLDGVRWHNAPIPPRSHRCWVQTDAWTNYFTQVWRCACGAICLPRKGAIKQHWDERNSRQHGPSRKYQKEAGEALPLGTRLRRLLLPRHGREEQSDG